MEFCHVAARAQLVTRWKSTVVQGECAGCCHVVDPAVSAIPQNKAARRLSNAGVWEGDMWHWVPTNDDVAV